MVGESWIREQGLRDARDFPYAKPAGTLRVLALGDSHTQGYEVRQEATYAAVLERYLKGKGRKAEVLNAGVSGYSTAEAAAYLENEGHRYQPDVVVLGFYANDFEDNLKAGLFGLEGGKLVERKRSHIPGVRVQGSATDLISNLIDPAVVDSEYAGGCVVRVFEESIHHATTEDRNRTCIARTTVNRAGGGLPVERLRERGIDATDPLPADTVFLRMVEGRADAVVALTATPASGSVFAGWSGACCGPPTPMDKDTGMGSAPGPRDGRAIARRWEGLC